MPTLSIVIPCYNEEATIQDVLERVSRVQLCDGVNKEILVVDDGSSDRSRERIQDWIEAHPRSDVKYIQRSRNGGKGAAVRDGIAASTGDILIIQDADLEYDPEDFNLCIRPILKGETLVVYGSRERFKANHAHSSWAFYAGGMLVSLWFSMLYGTWLTDEPTCYKTFAGQLIRNLPFTEDGFGWEPEVTAKLLRLGYRIVEVPIRYRPRTVNEGKKISWRDGLQALAIAWKWRWGHDAELTELRKQLPSPQ